MATTVYLRVSTGTQGSAILLQKQVSKASIAKIVGDHLPLYQDKALTPTPLKDIFTPIWAGPFVAVECCLRTLCATAGTSASNCYVR
jgi:hypothetical protein